MHPLGGRAFGSHHCKFHPVLQNFVEGFVLSFYSGSLAPSSPSFSIAEVLANIWEPYTHTPKKRLSMAVLGPPLGLEPLAEGPVVLGQSPGLKPRGLD